MFEESRYMYLSGMVATAAIIGSAFMFKKIIQLEKELENKDTKFELLIKQLEERTINLKSQDVKTTQEAKITSI